MPRPGETLTGSDFHKVFGGKSANQAVTAARLGARVSFVARLGNDSFGREMLANLGAEKLDTIHVKFDESRPTGVAGILVDDEAENCIVVVPGANAALSPLDVREAARAIEAADLLLGQLEVPLETTLEAFRIARAAGVRTILTPAPAGTLPDELYQLTDLLVPNESESGAAGRKLGRLGRGFSAIRIRACATECRSRDGHAWRARGIPDRC